jgi:hypothetical protein
MKKWPAAVVALGVVGIVLFLLVNSFHRPPGHDDTQPASVAPPTAAPSVVKTESNSAPAPPQTPGLVPPTKPVPAMSATAPLPVSAPAPTEPLVDGLPPVTVLDNMRTAVRQYGLRFGGNPVGTNPEITKALNGGNPKQVKFIPPDAGLRINNQGELIDPWGTPFFFHQLSAMEMEVRSAGPDKIMWTDDDLVTK